MEGLFQTETGTLHGDTQIIEFDTVLDRLQGQFEICMVPEAGESVEIAPRANPRGG